MPKPRLRTDTTVLAAVGYQRLGCFARLSAGDVRHSLAIVQTRATVRQMQTRGIASAPRIRPARDPLSGRCARRELRAPHAPRIRRACRCDGLHRLRRDRRARRGRGVRAALAERVSSAADVSAEAHGNFAGKFRAEATPLFSRGVWLGGGNGPPSRGLRVHSGRPRKRPQSP